MNLTEPYSKNLNFYQDKISLFFDEHKNILKKTYLLCKEDILPIVLKLKNCINQGGTIYFCGNGGSASDSQHIAAELIGRYKNDRKPLKAISLNTDTSVLTCISNDYSYEDVYSRQLQGLLGKKDLLFALTTSGNSKNIISALKTARAKKSFSICLTGNGGGEAINYADKTLVIPSSSTARIQEMHITIGHIIVELLEMELGID